MVVEEFKKYTSQDKKGAMMKSLLERMSLIIVSKTQREE